MNDRCKICVDPTCDGRMDCDCSKCDKKDCCPRVLRPTIRITRRCTQQCQHCCFHCSPKKTNHMPMESAKVVACFLQANGITYANIMGGEFWLCRNWQGILETLIKPLTAVSVVTNGDWASTAKKAGSVLRFFDRHQQCYMRISKDRWHTNKNVEAAAAACEKAGIPYRVQDKDDKDCIVPIGRSAFEFGFYSMFACHCRKPDHMYEFLIDETGKIYKCGFGVWDYTHVENHLKGDFHCTFKDFGLKFNKTFVGNCARCIQSYHSVPAKEQRESVFV